MSASSPHPDEPDLPPKRAGAAELPAAKERRPPARPRWVNAFAIAVVILIALLLVLHLSGLVPMHA